MPRGHNYVKCAWADNTYVLKSWIKHWQAWQLQVSKTFSDRRAKTWELYNIIQHCNHESRLGWNIRLKSTTSNHHVHLPQNNNASDFSTDCSQKLWWLNRRTETVWHVWPWSDHFSVSYFWAFYSKHLDDWIFIFIIITIIIIFFFLGGGGGGGQFCAFSAV